MSPARSGALWLRAGQAAGLLATLLTALPAAAQDPASELFNAHFCFACHSVSRTEVKKLGPYLADVAAKYGSRPDAAAYLTSRVLGGSQGLWGDAKVSVMPPNKVTPEEAALLANWVLKQK